MRSWLWYISLDIQDWGKCYKASTCSEIYESGKMSVTRFSFEECRSTSLRIQGGGLASRRIFGETWPLK